MSFMSNAVLQIQRQRTELRIFCRYLSLIRKRTKTNTKNKKHDDPRQDFRYPYIPGDPMQENAVDFIETERIDEIISREEMKQVKKVEKIKSQMNMFVTDTGLQFEKIMEGDIRLGRTLLTAKTGKKGKFQNESESTILLEGVRLIKDAIMMGAQAKALYFTDPVILEKLPKEHLIDIELYKILYRDMKTWSDTTTPAGLLGVFRMPHKGEVFSNRQQVLPITVILDGLKDPGNAGTIIRTAAAVGCERVIAVQGTVNIWEGKVLRSAMGGHFGVPLYWGESWSDMSNHLGQDYKVLLASNHDEKVLAQSFDTDLSLEEVEHEVQEAEIDSDEADSSDSDTELSETQLNFKEKKMESSVYSFHKVPLPVNEYSDISLSHDEDSPKIALVLGGETAGLSAQAKKFAFANYGQYLTIPMCPPVDSLNTGIAASICLYELRKKLLHLQHIKRKKFAQDAE